MTPTRGDALLEAVDRMDAVLDPRRGILAVPYDSATATGIRNDLALIRRALAAPAASGDAYTFDVIEEAWGDTVPLTKKRFDLFRRRLAELRQHYATRRQESRNDRQERD